MAQLKLTEDQKVMLKRMNMQLSTLKKLKMIHEKLDETESVTVTFKFDTDGEHKKERINVILRASAVEKDIAAHAKWLVSEIRKKTDQMNIVLTDAEKEVIDFFR